jgi:hypothetical protein
MALEKVSNKDWEDISQQSYFFILAILEIMLRETEKRPPYFKG